MNEERIKRLGNFEDPEIKSGAKRHTSPFIYDLNYSRCYKISITEIVVSKNIREKFNDEDVAELAESIKEKGILQPIILRKVDKWFEIICGERRYRAALLLGLKEVPAIVGIVSDKDIPEIQLIENLQRKGLDVMDEANAFRDLEIKFGYSAEKIGKKIGKPKTYILRRLAILKIRKDFREKFASKELSVEHIKYILPYKDNDAVLDQVMKNLKEKKYSVADFYILTRETAGKEVIERKHSNPRFKRGLHKKKGKQKLRRSFIEIIEAIKSLTENETVHKLLDELETIHIEAMKK